MSVEDKSVFDVLADGQWHWVPGNGKDDLRKDQLNTLWVHEEPSTPGYHPQLDGDVFRADYFPEADGIPYMGMDVFANNGKIAMMGRELVAVVVTWPMPEFMGLSHKESSWFIRTWNETELRTKHFHLPLGFILMEDSVRRAASTSHRLA